MEIYAEDIEVGDIAVTNWRGPDEWRGIITHLQKNAEDDPLMIKALCGKEQRTLTWEQPRSVWIIDAGPNITGLMLYRIAENPSLSGG
jgi:hypothetical protein